MTVTLLFYVPCLVHPSGASLHSSAHKTKTVGAHSFLQLHSLQRLVHISLSEVDRPAYTSPVTSRVCPGDPHTFKAESKHQTTYVGLWWPVDGGLMAGVRRQACDKIYKNIDSQEVGQPRQMAATQPPWPRG